MTNKKEKDITFGEFQQWINGLIEGKRGKLPDLEDWKRIKAMMDCVRPDVETITVPNNVPYTTPYIPPYGSPNPWDKPIDAPNIWPTEIWCGSSTSKIGTGGSYTLTTTDIDMSSINKLKTME